MTIRRRVALVAAASGALLLFLTALEPGMVFRVDVEPLATPAYTLRVVTDVDYGGPLSRLFRGIMYGLLAVGVTVAAAVTAAVARSGRSGPAALALVEALGASCLALGAELVAGPVIRLLGTPDIVAEAVSAVALGLLGFSVARMVHFAAVFPRPLSAEELAGASGAWATGAGSRAFGVPLGPFGASEKDAGRIVAAVRTAEARWLAPVLAGVLVVLAAVDFGLGTLAFLFAFFAFVTGGYSLVRLRESMLEGEDRVRLRWIVVGFSVSAWTFVILTVAPFALGPLLGGVGYGIYLASSLGLAPFAVYLAMVVCVALAVFYSGDLDPSLALRRSTLVGSGLVLFVGVFGAVENLASEWIEARLGLHGAAGTLITGAVIAVGLLPLRPLGRRLAAKLHGDAEARPPEGHGRG